TITYSLYLSFFYCSVAHRDLPSFPTRRSSDLDSCTAGACDCGGAGAGACPASKHCVAGACVCDGVSCPSGCCGSNGKCNASGLRSEEHTSELQSRENLVCRLLLEKKKQPCKQL